MKKHPDEYLTTQEVAKILGISSTDTVKNWLQGGSFPGAIQLQDSSWLFSKHEVYEVKERGETIREKNAKGDLSLPDDLDEGQDPPLF